MNAKREPIPFETEKIGKAILDAAFIVHSALGPGLLESVYETCLAYELRQSGLQAKTQVPFPIFYGDMKLEAGMRIDLLVQDLVIVEIKAVESLQPVHEAQLLTYLKVSQKRLGFLLNFNVHRLKDGIKRMVIKCTHISFPLCASCPSSPLC